MNYFGHAVVASWQVGDDDLGALAFGAMLPDLSSMCGARLAASADLAIARGIDLHHATDRVFHQSPTVLAAFRTLAADLIARGCRKGPARGAAHVAVELLLDGLLVDEPAHRAAYTAALAIDPAPLTWRDPAADPPRFAWLLSRLRAHGVPDDLRDPAAVTARVVRTLRHRPLLAMSDAEGYVLGSGLSGITRELRAIASELRTAMTGAGASS